jgi:predicted Zn-dependent protease/uncharacterized protein involved in exopolysaccharide biosynthesis
MSRSAGKLEPPDFATFVEIIDLRDALHFLRGNWKALALFSILGLSAGLAWTYFFPSRFASEARVRFMPPQLAGRFVNPNFSMQVEQRLFALSQLLSSRLTATRLIETFQLYPERRRFQTVADLVPVFQNDLVITQIGKGDDATKSVPTLQIRFLYPAADLAQKVTQKLVEQIYEENRKYRGDQSLGTTEFLAEQLRTAEEKMLDAEARYGEIQDALRPNVSKMMLGESTSRSYVVDSRLRDLRHDRRLLEERRLLKQAEAAQAEADLRMIDARQDDFYFPMVHGNSNYWHLIERTSVARANAVRMRERWRPGFADRELADLELAEAERELGKFLKEQARLMRAQERDRQLSKSLLARSELRALELQEASSQKEELELRAEAQRLKDQTVAPAGMETDLLTAKREYEIAKELHGTLLKKHEESQAASDMERRGQGEAVELLEPPSLPSKAESPTKTVRVILAVLGGLFVGLFVCLANSLRNPRILHEGHLEKWAGLEVLAVFPAAACRREQKRLAPPGGGNRQTWRRRALTTAALVVAVLSVGCTDRFLGARALWTRGQTAEKEGRATAALLFYRQAIRKDARFAPAYRSAGLLALRQGEIVVARDFLSRAIEFDADDADMHAKLADTTYQIYFSDPGRPTTVLREVEALAHKLQARWPRRADGYRLAAQVLMERHRTEEAVALLRNAAAKVDNSDTLDAQAAAALFRLGRQADAESLLREVIARSPVYSASYDLLYLQLMQRKNNAAAREVLELKWSQTADLAAALQLAAHDDAFKNRASAKAILDKLGADKAAGPLALARIGDFWMNRGEAAFARASYDLGLTRHPHHATDYISRIAEWFLTQKQPDAAKQFIAKALANRPNDLILQAYSSAIQIADLETTKRVAERRKLEFILQQLPESPFVRYHLARAYLLEGTVKAAVEQFERCVTLDPNYAPGWVALAELEIARGNPTAAEARAESVLRTDPNHLPANLVRAKAQVTRGRAHEAEQTLQRILAVQPSNVDAIYLLGSAQASGKNPLKALPILEKGRALAPQEGRWALAEAELLLRQGSAAAAREKLEDAFRSGNREESLLYRLAALQIADKDSPAALRSFQILREQNPQSIEYRLGHAGAHAISGDRQAALALYTETETLFPDNALVRLQHGALLSEMNQRDAALTKYQEALDRDKNNPYVLNNLAWLMLQHGGPPEKALEYVLQARRTFGRSPEIDDTLATAYLRLSMFRNATAVYEEMLTYLPSPERPRVRKLLEEAKRNLTKREEA